MSIQVSWFDDKQRILYFAMQPGWAWEELNRQIERALRMIRAGGVPTPVILDVGGDLELPQGNLFQMDNLQEVNRLLKQNARRTAPVVVVHAGEQTRLLYESLRLIDPQVGRQVFFTDSLDDARAYLEDNCIPIS
ncbi:MAG: hypothetical protein CL610_00325 [Anaerolineaceae bacterium]|nr:hypothetical protein [Anaerolineaceae bacterium]